VPTASLRQTKCDKGIFTSRAKRAVHSGFFFSLEMNTKCRKVCRKYTPHPKLSQTVRNTARVSLAVQRRNRPFLLLAYYTQERDCARRSPPPRSNWGKIRRGHSRGDTPGPFTRVPQVTMKAVRRPASPPLHQAGVAEGGPECAGSSETEAVGSHVVG
jgi:hypothetical protein